MIGKERPVDKFRSMQSRNGGAENVRNGKCKERKMQGNSLRLAIILIYNYAQTTEMFKTT